MPYVPLLTALIAGLVSYALLIAFPATGILGIILAQLAPLPLLILRLTFAPRWGMIAAGALFFYSLFLGSWSGGLSVTLFISLPALLLGSLCQKPFVRLDLQHNKWLSFSPASVLLQMIIAISVASVFSMILLKTPSYAQYTTYSDHLIEQLSLLFRQIQGHVEPSQSVLLENMSRKIVLLAPAAFSAWLVVSWCFNLWLGKTIASSVLKNRVLCWPDIARSFSLPPLFVPLFICALVLSHLESLTGLFSFIMVGSILMGFTLHGLAFIHFHTRDKKYRPYLLALMYSIILLFSLWPLLVLAFLGIMDTLYVFFYPEPSSEA